LPGKLQQWRQVFRLSPDRPGDLPLPPPALRVRAGGRETPIDINWQPLTVHVTTTILRADLDEARGVTGPESAPPSTPMLWQDERFWAASIVIIAVITALFAGRKVQPPAPVIPPAEWVAAELDRLDRLDASDPRAADALAELLREFLDRVCKVPAIGKNTPEIVGLLHNASPESITAWRSLLERCDLARFTCRGFTPVEWQGALTSCKSLMAETLPVGETTASAAAGSTSEKA
jgi:hypothetical protein